MASKSVPLPPRCISSGPRGEPSNYGGLDKSGAGVPRHPVLDWGGFRRHSLHREVLVSESLDEFPLAFRGAPEPMPWETPSDAIRWQWGADKGKALTEIPSRELVRKRNWLQRDPEAFAWLIRAIDQVLIERAGE